MTRALFFIAQGALAFLPALLVILVSREDPGLAADFSIALGLVGATFSIAFFGQRAYIVIRGFDAIPAREAISFRIILTFLAGLVALLLAEGMQLGLALGLFAVGVKLSEGAVDLWVGLCIRARSETGSARRFAGVALARLALVGAPVLWIGARQATQSAPVLAYLFALSLALYALLHLDTQAMGLGGSYRIGARALRAHAWELRSFMSATAACAVLAVMPRAVLPYVDPLTYTAAALSLSLAPIFGLACQAIWLANLKRLSTDLRRQLPRFLIELVALLAVVALLRPAWELVAQLVYGLEESADQQTFAATFLCGSALFVAIGMSNLFKLSRRPRNEAIGYALGTGCILLATQAFGAQLGTALLAAAGALALFLAISFRPLTP